MTTDCLDNIAFPEEYISAEEQSCLDFLNLVLPPNGDFYSTSYVVPGQIHTWTDEVQNDFLTMIRRSFMLSKDGYNTYYGLSSFKQGRYKLPNKRKKVFRLQENTKCQKALWLDIDCGKKKSPYSTEYDALVALYSFLQQTHLPSPTIIFSGKGLHIYWPFSEVIYTEQWQQISGLLKALTIHFKLHVDHSRTTDPSSVLRLPGTLNYKDGIAREVSLKVKSNAYPIIDITKILIESIKLNNITPTILNKPQNNIAQVNIEKAPQNVAEQFGVIEEYTKEVIRHPYRIIKECKQIQQSGVGTYTQWYNMMLVMKHCAFANEAVHALSKTDTARYEENNVNQKFQQAIDGGYGPALCTTFDEKDPGICKDCVYWGKIKTPLLLGEVYNEAKPVSMPGPVVNLNSTVSVVIDTVPSMQVIPYTSKEFSVIPGTGVVWHKRELISGESVDPEEDIKNYITKDIIINDNEIYIHSICIDDTTQNIQRSYVIRKKPKGKSAEDILFDMEGSFGQQQSIKWLGQHGMLPAKPKYYKPMSDFMSTYIAAIQNKLPEIKVYENFGWTEVYDKVNGTKEDAFIIGDTLYSTGSSRNIKLNDKCLYLSRDFRSSGTLEEWKAIPNMYSILDQKAAQLFICAGFAAPFMRYGTGTAINAAFNMWDIKGGKGKSTLLQVINSIWGEPVELMVGKNDTLSARYQRMSAFKNLPVTMDEITQMSEAEIADLLYDVANGREKQKSTSSGTNLAHTGNWATVTFFTSNKSLYETMRRYNQQSQATSMRVLEIKCDFPDYAGTGVGEYIEETIKLLKCTYGTAGRYFIQKCFEYPDLFSKVAEAAALWDRDNRKYSDERFWMYAIGMALSAGRVAKALGLLPFDMDALETYCNTYLIETLRGQIRDTEVTGESILCDFLNENIHSSLVVAFADRPKNIVDTGAASGLDTYVKRLPQKELFIRFEQDTRTLYVSARALTLFHSANNLSLDTTLSDLELRGIWKKGDKYQYSLGRCVTAIERGRSVVYKFNGLLLNGVDPEFVEK